MDNLTYIRQKFSIHNTVNSHTPERIKRNLKNIVEFTDIKFGNIHKNEGDIVVVNLKEIPEVQISFKDYMNYFYMIDRIEQKGIYTNIYWKRELFTKTIQNILYSH